MATDREVLDILRTRRFTVEPHGDGWIARLPGGNRVQSDPHQPTPEAAIEAADAYLTEREAAMALRDARRLIQEQERGELYAQPRVATGPEGEPVTVFDLRRSADRTVVVEGAASVTDAWIRRPAAVAEGDIEPAGGGRAR
jgi:hypothetical protein